MLGGRRITLRAGGPLAFFVFLLLLHLALPFLYQHVAQRLRKTRFSYFWEPDLVEVRRAGARLEARAKDQFIALALAPAETFWFSRHGRPTGPLWQWLRAAAAAPESGERPLCLAINSVPRKSNATYVVQIVAAMLAFMTPDQRARTPLLIYSRESGHPLYDPLRPFVPILPPILDDEEKPEADGFLTRQVRDYTKALRACLPLAKLSLVIEDDSFPAEGFLTLLEDSVLPRLTPTLLDDLAFLKLYYTPMWWAWGNDAIAILLILCVAPAFLAVYGLSFVFLWLRPRWLLRLVLTAYFSLLILVALYRIGRQNVLWQWPLGLSPFHEPCCSQAHIYTRRGGDQFLAYAKGREHTQPIDLLLDDWAVEDDLARYLFVPNLFQHIGLASSDTRKNQGDARWAHTSRTFPQDLFGGEIN